MYITHVQRSSLTKCRCCVAPLCLATGCYEGLPKEERVYPVCSANTVEYEYYATMPCLLRNQKSEICLFNPFISYIEYSLIYIYRHMGQGDIC